MPKSRYQPLRIDIRVDGLMAVPERDSLMLDSLLLSLGGTRYALPFPEQAVPVQVVRDKRWPTGCFVWLASALRVQWHGPSSDRFLTRNARPLELLDDAAGHNATSVDAGAGITKVSRRRITLRHASIASGWCMGDAKALEALLTGLRAIGAYRHGGHGVVRSVEVSIDPAAHDLAWSRPLPGAHADDPFANRRFRAPGRATAPYWDRDLRQEAWWPVPQLPKSL